MHISVSPSYTSTLLIAQYLTASEDQGFRTLLTASVVQARTYRFCTVLSCPEHDVSYFKQLKQQLQGGVIQTGHGFYL